MHTIAPSFKPCKLYPTLRMDMTSQYAGTVMMSFDYVVIPTHGNWFQTNPLKNESYDRAGNTVSSVCVTNGKDMELQRQI